MWDRIRPIPLSFLRKGQAETKKVIIVGAGWTGQKILEEYSNRPELSTLVVGIVDDNPNLYTRFKSEHILTGQVSEIPRLADRTGATELLIAIPEATPQEIRKIVDISSTTGLRIKKIPESETPFNGENLTNHILDVNPEDLLGRLPVQLDLFSVGEMLESKSVLVTGAGGSIGSEICRQIAQFNPEKLILIENTELFLYNIETEMTESFPDLNIVPVIGDIRNRKRIEEVISRYKPEVIFHAAAYKHVPIMETNPAESVITNVSGTRIVAETAVRFGVQRFVYISTDKAVNPVNVMGCTKRIGELLCQDFQKSGVTRFMTVRFGNVLGSTGSVLPRFLSQISQGGPVTITHPDIRRYFMSISEAAQLVLQAGAMGSGGEVFVLDMGEPIKIIDLARQIIALSGFIPEKEIPIAITGLRPGEKLYEELLIDGEATLATTHPSVRVARMSGIPEHFHELMDELIKLAQHNESSRKIKKQLTRIISEYKPFDAESAHSKSIFRVK